MACPFWGGGVVELHDPSYNIKSYTSITSTIEMIYIYVNHKILTKNNYYFSIFIYLFYICYFIIKLDNLNGMVSNI